MKNNTVSFLEHVEQELSTYLQHVSHDDVEKGADIIQASLAKGGRVHVTGIGKPSYVAGYVASLLSSTGTPAYTLDGTEAVHGSSGQVVEGDVVIAISNSGETEELKSTVLTLLANKAHVIACTRNKNSWLATHASVCLEAYADQEGDPLNKPPRISILKELIILQALSVELQVRHNITKEDYLKWHPGGSLGQTIREEI